MAITFTYLPDGVALRPRKKRPAGTQSLTLTFYLKGSIPSKKNNQVPVIDWRQADKFFFSIIRERPFTADDYFQLKRKKVELDGGEVKYSAGLAKPRIVPNKRHQQWHAKALDDIIAQRDRQQAQIALKGLIYPLSDCSVKVYTYKCNTSRRDHTNRMDSIADLLKDALVIIDDNDKVLNPMLLEADEYKGEVVDHETVIYLTAYYRPPAARVIQGQTGSDELK